MMNTIFKRDILEGLNSAPKQLSSKYFYDEKGSEIFQEIMQMKSYYLPGCETEILTEKSQEIISRLPNPTYDVVELGAGDGTKTALFLDALLKSEKTINYLPLDISPEILEVNKDFLIEKFPDLNILPIAGDYFETLEKIKPRKNPKIVLFLGSNIGNFEGEKAVAFLKFVRQYLVKGDLFMLGADLKKHPQTILKAYDDPEGITKRFNLNLLHRINRELEGNFIPENYDHYASYDPLSGTTKSFLISKIKQNVQVGGQAIDFEKNEPVHMEISQKYNISDLIQLRENAGFKTDHHFTDSQKYFSISLFEY
ncbi:L-histidine N(alpha)-methyltransferase [uncultured Cyclobacterium sp.]|uniref:L-histidine N(alpha)-methyltransferase n=1 Tax=uncultured Cyclobacterium sp. TaxID=453820 RepID=UPI0030ED1CDE|tara:strand:- start:52050 stop:52982 length:933 start_codon:yes stop_codon:yes gene_type:complete